MLGTVGILSVGAGDTKLSFDPNNPQDRIRAARIVKDMLRRGYSLLVAMPGNEGAEPKYRRAYDFDENTFEYIIADFDPTPEETIDVSSQMAPPKNTEPLTTAQTTDASSGTTMDQPRSSTGRKGGKGKRKERRIPAAATNATAVARTAGG